MAAPASPPVLDIAALRLRLETKFRVYDVQSDEHVVAFYVDAPKETLERDFEELKRELRAEGLIPLLKYQGGEHAIYILRSPQRVKRGYKLNLVLFLLTVATTTLAGAMQAYSYYGPQDLSEITQSEALRQMVAVPMLGLGFLTFALPLLLILGIHEMGHYVMTRRHGMEASLPFFIPVPPLGFTPIGTFGAFIAMREPMPNKKALFDIGAAGPIAGFVIAVPVVLLGLYLTGYYGVLASTSDSGGTVIGTPLLFDALALPFNIPDNVVLHPTAFAGWVGLFVTAINMLPAGQLDGGHIASAMFGDRARYASYGAVAALFAVGIAPMFGFPGSESWLFFAILIGLLGIRHPPTLNAVSSLDGTRMLIGWGTFVMGALCFTLIPFPG